MKFELSDDEQIRVLRWTRELEQNLALEQLKDADKAPLVVRLDDGTLYPYLGAIGGGLSFVITTTSLGDVFRVYWCMGTELEQSLDLTDYDLW